MSISSMEVPATPGVEDFLPQQGTDFIEFYMGNAKQAAHYYCNAFGFRPPAYKGPETGTRDRSSYVLRQHKLSFVFTTPLRPGTEIAKHIYDHGDGVKCIALRVDDATAAWEETTALGARSYCKPQRLNDDCGSAVISGIHTYGDTVHLFIERKDYNRAFLPGYEPWHIRGIRQPDAGLLYVEHCVGNVGWYCMNEWVSFYEKAMGFKNILSFNDQDISTEYSALMSKVMSNGNGYVKFLINESAKGKKKSQVEEYLEFYNGEGVQHIALATGDIITTVRTLMDRGVEFLSVPSSYYDELPDGVGEIAEDIESLREPGILVDRDTEGYLLQLFPKPVQDRPTVFFGIIQRRGAKSFGKGNFKALFEAIEQGQVLRGNL